MGESNFTHTFSSIHDKWIVRQVCTYKITTRTLLSSGVNAKIITNKISQCNYLFFVNSYDSCCWISLSRYGGMARIDDRKPYQTAKKRWLKFDLWIEKLIVPSMQNVMYKVPTVPSAIRCETLLPVISLFD